MSFLHNMIRCFLLLLPFSLCAETFSRQFPYNGVNWIAGGTDTEGAEIFVDDNTEPLPSHVTIPGNTYGVLPHYFVTSIGNRAFYGTSGMTSVTIPDTIKKISLLAFSGTGLRSVIIPDSVETISSSVFKDCTSLQLVQLPAIQGEDFDGREMFSGCTQLRSVSIPSAWTFIPNAMFSGCTSLQTVTFPNTLSVIGGSAFKGCESLTKIRLSSALTSIGSSAFSGSGICEVDNIPEAIATTCSAFTFGKRENLIRVTLNENVTALNTAFFESCTKLESIQLPKKLTIIPRNCFSKCMSLKQIHLPDRITSIESSAFYQCSSLEGITIPEGVTTIGQQTFDGCSALATVTFEGAPPTTVGGFAFRTKRETVGYYSSAHASAWKAVIDTNGKWNGLIMLQKAEVVLPEGISESTQAWLRAELETAKITSGKITLASGTTAETLEAARLLGITPSVTLTSEGAIVATESDFTVREIVVTDESVLLSVRMAVGVGTLPETLSLGGTVKLMVCNDLDGVWTEITPTPSQITLTRVSDTEANLSLTQNLGEYTFFKVIVK